QALLDCTFVLGATPAQTFLQFSEAWRQDENRDRIARVFLANLTRALNIDVKQDVSAASDGTVKCVAGRAVAGVEDPRPFRQFTRCEPASKFLVRHETVIDPLALAGAWHPGR